MGKFSIGSGLGAALAGIAALCAAGSVSAGELKAPTGKPILTISGAISQTNVGDTAVFDREMLEALEQKTIITKTPWYDDKVTFEGVPLDTLMETVGAHGDKVTAVALNDYSTEIPVSDFAEKGAILALKRDGQYMPVRDKGPLFIVYPYDSDESLQTQVYYGRSAWQLAKMIVE